MVSTATVVIYDHRLYAPGHLVHNWAVGVTRDVKAGTKLAAPENKRPNKSASALAKDGPKGALKRSIRGSTSRAGLRRIESYISANTSYAAFVALGTGEIAREDMFLPFNPGFGTPSSNSRRKSDDGLGNFKDVVRGQTANNYFEKGLDIAAAKHPALR